MNSIEKRYLTKIDEINQLFYKPTENYDSAESLKQAVHDFLVDMYLEGFAATGYLLDDRERPADFGVIEELILLNIGGKTLYDRIDEYYAFSVANNTPKTENEQIRAVQTETEALEEEKPFQKPKMPDGNTGITPDEAILRVIETESHRMYGSGSRNRAVSAGAKYKEWNTMADDKVRDSHSYIWGEKIGIDDYFFTYDGDSALMPGGFELPENNVNCRCWLSYSF